VSHGILTKKTRASRNHNPSPRLPGALETEGIKRLKQLSKKTEAEILKLHGMGPAAIPKLKASLKKDGLAFKK
jgi:DNA-directed RNA polymerase alpha subunit